MRLQKSICLIVDGYSTGAHIAPLMRANGIACGHVQSCPNINNVYYSTFVQDDYLFNIIWSGLSDLLEKIAEYHILWVISGAEIGVLLADEIAHQLKIPQQNNYNLSLARRDKYVMHEAIKKSNLRSIYHIKIDSLAKISTWLNENNIQFPVVIKPVNSASSDGVTICNNFTTLEERFNTLINNKNFMGTYNHEVIVQSFLSGQEYAVNTISYNGKHIVTEIMRANKKIVNGHPIHDHSDMIDYKDNPALFTSLSQYVMQVLDALGIKYGAGHTEVMDVPNIGPTLIECGARLNGGIDISAYTFALGYNQLSVMMESLLNPDTFLQRTNKYPPIKKYLRVVFLISYVSGQIIKQPNLDGIKSLKSFHSITMRNTGTLNKTKDFCYNIGYINLVSNAIDIIEEDYKKIRQLEPQIYQEMLGNNQNQVI